MSNDLDENGRDASRGDAIDHEARDAAVRRAAERDHLLEERRARQTGKPSSGKKSGWAMVLFLIGGALLIVGLAIGPNKVLRLVGLGDEDAGPRTSKVDLEVDRRARGENKLDFLVPAVPAEEKVDPNAEWNERFKALQGELEAIAQSQKGPEVKLSDVKDLLERYNSQISDKLEAQRKELAAENARLRAEAERARDRQRRAEEEARRADETRRRKSEINSRQIESGSVVVDQSSFGSGPGVDAAATGGQSRNARFLAANAGSGVETARSRALADPSRTVIQGTIISAVLETAINTELPGNIRAQVTEPVFSFDGSRILMPAGTVLIGRFNEDVEVAQTRVLIAWNRAVTPEGKSIAIGSTGADLLGRAGTKGNVNNRLGTKLGAAVLISSVTALPSVLSALASRKNSNSGTTINVGSSGSSGSSVGGQVAASVGNQVSEAGGSILEKYLSLPPIIRIPQGEEIRVFVNRDLVI